ncbi:Hypothetical predicted protein [Lecanosticta acicola]|uniref:Uncharacterized protein n=1 Tax=Lecanosticta acicola TaxID=111012 RepID=A0AAI8Z2B6_9PEZI|nr:Hypothetical predicted protein [Lecanosticta acicola]
MSPQPPTRANGTAPTADCPFLELPVELRLDIYAYAVLDYREITVGTAKLDGSHADIVHRLYGSGRSPFPGIPHHHEPVVDTRYQPALLSPAKPAVIPLTPANLDPRETTYEHTQTAYHTLSLLCKQVNDELKSHFAIPYSSPHMTRSERSKMLTFSSSYSSRRETSLFVQYPHGLHLLHTVTPQLLRQSRSVHLAGTYIPRSFCPPRAACLGPRLAPPQEKLHGDVIPESTSQLADLIKGMFGPDAPNPVEKMEMRIYYPGDDSYSTVWGDDSSPIVVALRHVHLGEVGIEIWRGRYGTGVYLTVSPTSEKKRVVSTVWRRLEEGRRGEPECGSWVVDSDWPAWNAEYEMSEGPRGDTIISVPR